MTEVDAYLAALDEPKRGTLEALRRAMSSSIESSDTSTAMAKKKKKTTKLTAEFWRKDAERQANDEQLLERRRLERERAQSEQQN